MLRYKFINEGRVQYLEKKGMIAKKVNNIEHNQGQGYEATE